MTSEKKKIIKEIEFYASLKEFSRHTAIPWFKCFFDSRFSYCERIIISAILSVGFIYASTLVYEVSRTVLRFPLVTNIESLQHSAWEQPFPTIYICPLNRISKDRIVKQVDKWVLPNNITKKELLIIMRSIPNGAYRLSDFKYSEMVAEIMATNNISIDRLFNEITLPCEKMIGFCQWRGTDFDCESIFTKVRNADGTCCAFNYIHPKQHYNHTSTRKMFGSGFNAGLRAALFINYSDGFSSFSSSWGYHIYAGAPGSFVDGRALARVLRQRAVNFYSFTSTRIESSKTVMELPERYRACSVPERKLAAFKTYTMENCKAECILNMSLTFCHCVPFIAPKYSDAMKYISSSGTNLTQFSENRFEIKYARSCNCLPSCEAYYDFDVSASSSPVHTKLFPEYVSQTNSDIKSGKNLENMEYFGEIFVYSQGNMLTKINTDVKYNITELMGFLGTIASFTMGWSIICVIEILHFVIQLAINYCINKIKEARQVEQFHPN